MAISEGRVDRLAQRRQATIEEALDHAERIVGQQGAGAVTIAEIARQMGMRPPLLYKYFPSLHGVYDALFARGNAHLASFVDNAVRDRDPGPQRVDNPDRNAVDSQQYRCLDMIGPLRKDPR